MQVRSMGPISEMDMVSFSSQDLNCITVQYSTKKVCCLVSFSSYWNSYRVDLFQRLQTTPPRPLIHGLKPFSIWISIRRENRL
jgi:hypothetical protein